jgi:hypothetical protein
MKKLSRNLAALALAVALAGAAGCGEEEGSTDGERRGLLNGATGATGESGSGSDNATIGGGSEGGSSSGSGTSGNGDDCDSNYSGACLDPNSPDYDCEGGSGDGPDYVGVVQVVGSDVYDLDADGDGTACDT